MYTGLLFVEVPLAKLSENRNVQSSAAGETSLTGTEKLQLLKSRLFPPQTKDQRVALALESLKKATKQSSLDSETLRFIVQHPDLEGL